MSVRLLHIGQSPTCTVVYDWLHERRSMCVAQHVALLAKHPYLPLISFDNVEKHHEGTSVLYARMISRRCWHWAVKIEYSKEVMAPQVPDLVCPSKGIVVFSGGSAANSLVDVFNEITQKRHSSLLSYIIPISDNGGSSSELIRVFGGPGIGDIRSRLVRLIPPNQPAIHALLNHRLSSSSSPALQDWQAIVAGTSSLWSPIPPAPRELLRSMLNHVNFEILKRARPPTSTFNFSHASVGNLFLTGARLFTGSFESAIHLLGLICGISEHVTVVPAINSNFSHHISAGLANGDVIAGQNAISHPSAPTALAERPTALEPPSPAFNAALGADSGISTPYSTTLSTPDAEADAHAEDANLPGSLPTLRQAAITFSKSAESEEDLPTPISRIWYINPYGQEIAPSANPRAVSVLRDAEAVIYSIGSLYTSIVPCLILRGIGEAISASPGLRVKVLILNGSLDRETGPRGQLMDAMDFVAAIARAGEESKGWRGRMGGREDAGGASGELDRSIWKRYVTHLIYLEGEGAPKVDRQALAEAGVECVRCWGRKNPEDGTWRYDPAGLVGALEAILGRGEKVGKQSRRNTMETYASPLPSPSLATPGR